MGCSFLTSMCRDWITFAPASFHGRGVRVSSSPPRFEVAMCTAGRFDDFHCRKSPFVTHWESFSVWSYVFESCVLGFCFGVPSFRPQLEMPFNGDSGISSVGSTEGTARGRRQGTHRKTERSKRVRARHWPMTVGWDTPKAGGRSGRTKTREEEETKKRRRRERIGKELVGRGRTVLVTGPVRSSSWCPCCSSHGRAMAPPTRRSGCRPKRATSRLPLVKEGLEGCIRDRSQVTPGGHHWQGRNKPRATYQV